ncbi:FAD-binding protein [Amycolatopsis sp. NPDC004747]
MTAPDASRGPGPDDDFGHLVRRRPAAVHRPGDADELAALVAGSAAFGKPVVVRGEGHATFGQAQTDGGVLADLRSLAGVLEVTADRVAVRAGTRWSAVVEATLAHGLTPPVLPNYLELSVGGTLVAGGFGGTAHRYGPMTDSVLELDVVTADGTRHTCRPGDELFAATLGGLGLSGVVVRAVIRLVPAPERVRRHLVPVPDLAALTALQRKLAGGDRWAYVEGQLQAGEGGECRYLLDVAAYYSAPGEPDDAAELGELGFTPGDAQTTDQPYAEFLHRMAAGEAAYRAAGDWFHPHPALNLLLPDEEADAFVEGVAAELTPADVGPSGVVLLYPVRATTAPLPRMPGSPTAFFFALLRTAPPDPVAAEALVVANEKLYHRARAVGGVQYPVGSVPLTPADWKVHFGPAWPLVESAKRRHDPENVLGGGQGVFVRGEGN